MMILVGDTIWKAWATIEFDGRRWSWEVRMAQTSADGWLSVCESLWKSGDSRSEERARARCAKALDGAKRHVDARNLAKTTRETIR